MASEAIFILKSEIVVSVNCCKASSGQDISFVNESNMNDLNKYLISMYLCCITTKFILQQSSCVINQIFIKVDSSLNKMLYNYLLCMLLS